MLSLLAAVVLSSATGPLTFAHAELRATLGSRAANVEVRVVSGAKETYRITSHNSKVSIVGGDEVGAMYGAFEFAERTRNEGARAWTTNTAGRPFLPDRGLNLFLTLPWNYQRNDTDYDLAALTDPDRWWFHNEDYWRTLLDLMAHSRLNWLDIHGTWDISVTDAPNLYAYFIQSDLFPKVGVPPEVKAAELRQLNHVIDMAHQRGIRVSLMAYQADLRTPQNRTPPYQPTEQNVYAYTREVVEKMIRQAPGLDAIGFRIGESGKSESFFKCYQEAVKKSGRDIPLVTRSWITKRQRVLPLARTTKDFTVEIKYNGEHWGAPYMVAGGRVANWYSYSFEDYLSDAGSPEMNRKTWNGWPTSEGGRWPSEPYKIVWQVRANGTHRIFPFYNPEWTRRTIRAMKVGTASGYTVEGMDAYFPKSPDYYLANPADKYCNWIHQRDELYWMCWGRLGYDPTTPESTFDTRAKQLLGRGSGPLVEAWKNTSVQMPTSFMAYSLGPDHRSHAPELEWGGDSDAFIHGQGFDSHLFEPIDEELANLTTDGIDARVPSGSAGSWNWLDPIDTSAADLQSASGRVREVSNAVMMQAALGSYYRVRLTAARQLALHEIVSGAVFSNDVDMMLVAQSAFEELADNRYYKPFTDRLRMHTNSFAWKNELTKIVAEHSRLSKLSTLAPRPVAPIPPTPPRHPGGGSASLARTPLSWPSSRKLEWSSHSDKVLFRVAEPLADRAWLLAKPLPSSTFFHRVDMHRAGNGFEVEMPRDRCGMQVQAVITKGDGLTTYPDPSTGQPYLVIPARPGPTPQIYNASEALTYLKPEVLNPARYGGLLIGTRAGAFNGFDHATKRKLLDPVGRGLRLVILQEDFNKFKLDWLPRPLRFETGNWTEFDPGGTLDLSKVDEPGIMWQRFLPSEGWDVFGNGGLARLKLGKGEVWVTSARLMQNMQYPDAARAFVRLLGLGGVTKPTVLVDSCSEGADGASSCHPDLMNSHGIPFLTLGELIYNEQGMDSFAPIPGPVLDDDVLGGHGTELANTFLRSRVMKLSARAAARSLSEFESERKRRRHELMRALGLDPMPPKTPLNARTTGSLQRSGYRIEKVVFESRPGFYVTAHVYVPDAPSHARLPAIVNVNGHWAHKKDEDRVQLRCAFAALHGYLAVAVDSPGFSFEGNNLIERRAEGDHNDFKLVEGGSNTTGYYVWDTIRAVDYLSTRDDVDMNRLGITGASGGGLATLYAFAAEDRFKAAVPVVYMSSLELAPDNGCLCNHVPGTCQIGDRSDVIAIQAPKPVLIMGAQQDGEFPPDAMRLTQAKMAKTWSLFPGGDKATGVIIFPGGHDYSRPMREAMIGFFDQHLKSEGDGSPVPEPAIEVLNPEDHRVLVLDPPIAGERTMRDLSKEYLAQAPIQATWEQIAQVNGGLPEPSDLNVRGAGTGSKRYVIFESEPGLQTPGILLLPAGQAKGIRIVASDHGKAEELASHPPDMSDGYATLILDVLGTGELSGIEMRYAVYAGRSVAFTAGWQIARAVAVLHGFSDHVEVVGRGPLSSQAAMYAALMKPTIAKTTGLECLHTWADVFDDGITDYAVQPRAHLCG